jgi:hypothetical protein
MGRPNDEGERGILVVDVTGEKTSYKLQKTQRKKSKQL